MLALPEGYALYEYDILDSTNEEASRRAQAGDIGPAVVWAKTQTAGRGRRGREWVSKPGNVFMSVLIDPGKPLTEASQLSFAASLAVKRTLEDVTSSWPEPMPITLKWPNDVLLADQKVSGILLEGGSAPDGNGGQRDYLIIGIGVNLKHAPEGAPFPATSLVANTGAQMPVDEVVSRITQHLHALIEVWQTSGFLPLRFEWLASADRLGETIDVQQGENRIQGTFLDVSAEGALQLGLEDGREETIHAGDVYFPDSQ